MTFELLQLAKALYNKTGLYNSPLLVVAYPSPKLLILNKDYFFAPPIAGVITQLGNSPLPVSAKELQLLLLGQEFSKSSNSFFSY